VARRQEVAELFGYPLFLTPLQFQRDMLLGGKVEEERAVRDTGSIQMALTSASAIPDRLNSATAAPGSRSLVCQRFASRVERRSATAMSVPLIQLIRPAGTLRARSIPTVSSSDDTDVSQ
jgi:hypothetical protein